MATRSISLGGNSATITYEGELSELQEKQMWKRAERNKLLTDTDWWANSDLVMSDDQKKYRKELRDLDFSDPDNITWPTKPS